MRQMGEDPLTVRDAGDRGAGAGQAAAERQPRRGMFDGFRPAPQRPAPESTPAGEREKAAPKRGMFDGLKLSAAPLKIGRAHVELQSLMRISYAVFCLKQKKKPCKYTNPVYHNIRINKKKTPIEQESRQVLSR